MDIRIAVERIKQAVSCRQLLSANGIKINRNGFCICPLHGDTDASMKIYGDRYYCFGCHNGGDVINLARELYGIGFKDAISRLNDEFSVGIDLESRTSDKDKAMFAFQRAIRETKRKKAKQQEKYWEESYLNSLFMWIWLNQQVQDNEPDPDEEWSPLFRGYIQARASAKEQLTESEVRRMMLNG